MITTYYPRNFAEWRATTRDLLGREIEPSRLVWQASGQASLFSESSVLDLPTVARPRLPREFFKLARKVACHRSQNQWAYLYSAAWRISHGEPNLLDLPFDRIIYHLNTFENEVQNSIEDLRENLHFTPRADGGLQAWFEPTHKVVSLAAQDLARRYARKSWTLFTPDLCASWDGLTLRYSEGISRNRAFRQDGELSALPLTPVTHSL